MLDNAISWTYGHVATTASPLLGYWLCELPESINFWMVG